MTGEEEAIGGTELLDADQVHEDWRGQAVVGRDAEAVGGGEGEDERVGGDQGQDGGNQPAHAHTHRVEDDARHPFLVAQPTHRNLANRVQNSWRIMQL